LTADGIGSQASVRSERSPAIRLESVSKWFPGQLALDDVSLEVERGRVHALLGENGSGKSTLIKILTGYYAADDGKVWINGTLIGHEAATVAYRLGLRCVHQDLGLIDEFNTLENISMTCGYHKRSRLRIDWASEARRARRLLDSLGVDMNLNQPLGKCSAVERTAVAIARAIADLNPDDGGCLLLDEPTAALPATEVDKLFAIVRQLKQANVGILYVSHRLDEIFRVADDVSVLRGGKLVDQYRVEGMREKDLIHSIVGRDVKTTFDERPAGHGDRAKPALEVRGLTGAELKGIDFTAYSGEVLGVAGLVGSGRSELAYLLHEKYHAADQSVRLTAPDVRRSKGSALALVPGDRNKQGMISEFTVRENITFSRLRSYSRASVVRRRLEAAATARWIKELEIRPTLVDGNYRTMSGGNQQKVLMAKWLSVEPSVLIVDEPSAGVDVGARQKLHSILRAHAKDGMSVIVCSSDLKELITLADRILVLNSGEIVAQYERAQAEEHGILADMMGMGG
jgi:ribose transport system ATP-binding protein